MRTENWTRFLEKPELNRPVVIEGLPGVGNVGKIAADFIAGCLESKLMATVTSPYLPPHVLVDEKGVAVPSSHRIYYSKNVGKSGKDVIFLLGEFQSLTPDGQGIVCDKIMKDVFLPYDISFLVTLGGYGIGQLVDNPRVMGVAGNVGVVETMTPHGVTFYPNEPPTGIVGASGTLITLSEMYGVDSCCILGETSGYYPDYKSAIKVVKVIESLLGLELDLSSLKTKAKQIDDINGKVMDYAMAQKNPDLGYIG